MRCPAAWGRHSKSGFFPLRDGADRFQWSLVLMPRAFEALEQAQVELVYTAMDTGTTQVVLRDERPSSFTLSEQTQRWIHDRLSAQTGQLRPGEAAPVVWLTPPGTTVKKLFMYLPLDASDPQAGWLGIAISDIASRLDFSHLHGSSFALYAPDGQPIVFGAGAPQSAYLDLTEEDGFASEPGHSYLERFVLSKSVGMPAGVCATSCHVTSCSMMCCPGGVGHSGCLCWHWWVSAAAAARFTDACCSLPAHI